MQGRGRSNGRPAPTRTPVCEQVFKFVCTSTRMGWYESAVATWVCLLACSYKWLMTVLQSCECLDVGGMWDATGLHNGREPPYCQKRKYRCNNAWGYAQRVGGGSAVHFCLGLRLYE